MREIASTDLGTLALRYHPLGIAGIMYLIIIGYVGIMIGVKDSV